MLDVSRTRAPSLGVVAVRAMLVQREGRSMKPLRAVTLTGTADAIAKATITNMADKIRQSWVDVATMSDAEDLAVLIEAFRAIRLTVIKVNWFHRDFRVHRHISRLDERDAAVLEYRLSVANQDPRSIPILYACSAGVTVLSIPRLALIQGGAA